MNPRRWLPALFVLVGASAFGPLAPSSWALSDALKEKGVLYFDENLPQPLLVPMAKASYLYSDRSLSAPTAVAFAKDTKVRIVGMAPEGFYIQGQHRGAPYTGWVAPDAVTVDAKILQQAQQRQQYRDAVKLAIKEKRLLEGMTFDEVRAARGKPDAASFRQENGQRIDTWRYITYERVPQRQLGYNSFGQAISQIVYVKVPVGEMAVDFREGVVTSIEQHTATNVRGNNPTLPLNR